MYFEGWHKQTKKRNYRSLARGRPGRGVFPHYCGSRIIVFFLFPNKPSFWQKKKENYILYIDILKYHLKVHFSLYSNVIEFPDH